MLRNDGAGKARSHFHRNCSSHLALFSTVGGPSVCRSCVGDAKCIQIASDCFRDTLESFCCLPTKLMQLKASVDHCHGNRHGQLKVALAACYKICEIQEPQMSLSHVRRCCNPETFTLKYDVKSKNSIAYNLKCM